MNQAGLSSILVAMALLAKGVIVVPQQPAKIPRIGILAGASESSTPPFDHSGSAAVTLLEIKTLQRPSSAKAFGTQWLNNVVWLCPCRTKLSPFVHLVTDENERLDFPKR